MVLSSQNSCVLSASPHPAIGLQQRLGLSMDLCLGEGGGCRETGEDKAAQIMFRPDAVLSEAICIPVSWLHKIVSFHCQCFRQ